MIAKFTVVIIFDNPGFLTIRPLKQCQTAWQRQRNTGRALMRWRDDSKTGIRCLLLPGSHIQSFLINGDRNQLHACTLQILPAKQISRLFIPTAVTCLQQSSTNQLHRALIAGSNKYLFRRAGDPAGNTQICRNGLAQRCVTGRIRIIHHRHFKMTQCLSTEPCPGLTRKGIKGRNTWLEGQYCICRG